LPNGYTVTISQVPGPDIDFPPGIVYHVRFPDGTDRGPFSLGQIGLSSHQTPSTLHFHIVQFADRYLGIYEDGDSAGLLTLFDMKSGEELWPKSLRSFAEEEEMRKQLETMIHSDKDDKNYRLIGGPKIYY